MRESNIAKCKRKESSLARFAIRAKKNDCLHDDVADFLLHNQSGVSRLADKLLNNEFVSARHTDPSYPI